VQAKAEAESQRIQKETISPIILQLRAIEKWDGKFPQVIGGSGACLSLILTPEAPENSRTSRAFDTSMAIHSTFKRLVT